MVYKVKDLIKIAEDNGWVFDRWRGDHRQFNKPGQLPLTIAGTDNKDVPIGTAKSILRQIKGSN